MAYYAERFEAAVKVLVGEGPVKQRLSLAYTDHLDALEEQELPVTVRNTLSDLRVAMHRVAPVGKESCVKASVQKMSPIEASSHAETIVKIYAALLSQSDRAEPLKVVDNEQKLPPRYLVAGS